MARDLPVDSVRLQAVVPRPLRFARQSRELADRRRTRRSVAYYVPGRFPIMKPAGAATLRELFAIGPEYR